MAFSANLLRTRLELSIGFAFLCVLEGSNILSYGFLAVKKAFYHKVHRASGAERCAEVKVKMNWYTLDNTSRNPCDEIGQ
jgi:hypothetical protein